MRRITHICLWSVLLLANALKASEITHWSKTDSNFSFTLQCERDAEYLIQRSTNLIDWTNVLHSFGATTNRVLRLPISDESITRGVFFRATRTTAPFGFVAKQAILLDRVTFIDSYDSSDVRYSTGGFYDPAKRRDNVGVGVLSSLVPGISTGGGLIYGFAATGVGGTVSGNVGDGAWLASNSGLQPGHVSDDFNVAIPDVVLPSPWMPQPPPLPGIIRGIYYTYVLAAGDYTFSMPVNFSTGGVYVQGRTRIYFQSSFTMSGTAAVTLAPGATVDIYMGGSMDLTGQCVINPTGIPAKCHIYGLPTSTSMRYASTAEAYCRFYAPNADIIITGNFDFFGSVVGNNIRFSGTSNIHFDEALPQQ